MASSINASTTAGVVTTADTSGVLNIQTAGTTAISIDASQAVSFTNQPTYSGGTANGVAYLNGSKVLTTGSALVFDGTNLGVGAATPTAKLHIGVASAAVNGTKGVRITNPAGTIVMLECGNGGDSFVGTTSGSDFNIRTNNITRATFDNAGNLLVGTTSTLGNGGGITVARSGSNIQTLTTNSTSGSAYYIGRFYSNSVEKGYIYFDGTNVSYVNLSDYRLKQDVQPMTGALAKVAQLKPCTYTWKSNGVSGQGFIAHELAEVVPDCVSGEKDAVDEEGTPRYQGVDTSFLVATLTAAIKEQQALITQLQADVAALKGASA